MAGSGDFHAGYQEIEGINLGYLQVNGRQMFALAQVLSDLFKDIPRTTISKKMETLNIKSRRCDLQELRILKSIQSVPSRAVQCSLISKEDLQALCSFCRGLTPSTGLGGPRRQHPRPQSLLHTTASSSPAPTGPAGIQPFQGGYQKAAAASAEGHQGVRINASPAPRAGSCHRRRGHCYRPAASTFPFLPGPDSPPRRPRLLPAIQRGSRTGSKQGTSAGYSSDSDTSLDGSSSSDSSEEGRGPGPKAGQGSGTEEDGSCSSASESDSSGDSVQSIRYRQAALPGPGRCTFLQPRGPEQRDRAHGGECMVLQSDPNLLLQFWTRALPNSVQESQEQRTESHYLGSLDQHIPGQWRKVRKDREYGVQILEVQHSKDEERLTDPDCAELGSPLNLLGGQSLPPQQRSPSPDLGVDWESTVVAGRRKQDLQQAGPNNGNSLGLSDQADRKSEDVAPGCKSKEAAASTSYFSIQPPAQEMSQGSSICIASTPQKDSLEPRREHFDRLIRQSKLWCYAKGFSADGKTLGLGLYKKSRRRCKTADYKSPNSKRAQSSTILSNKAFKGNGSEKNSKRRRLSKATEAERQQSSFKERAQKRERKNARKGNTNYKRVANALAAPVKNVFSLIANFPCTPSLVVGKDGDLCPAYSLGAKKSSTVGKTHPIWRWQLGGNAIPVPPSLKFRSYPLED
ncbi:elongin BC and Polycomb repressive complex 2-associated protein [Microcaecilia unicolor]|uniref:Elongin BC and Polycomb repressive complex 2-associated protein n=1 Tax=Microcaecilia unicolor TaxID=1415580 RepID=A0A6P7ZEW9_9AMPH|nr:elongin BC and Polycomb repressive complex 2-associated protein [Microcaecilia unicolor]